MIRTILFAAFLICTVAAKAQMPLSFGYMNGMQPGFRHFGQADDSTRQQKKWFLTKFASISTGFIGFNGGSGTFLSAPMGIQLNRQLTNNVYAFAVVTVAPSLFNFNGAFYQPVNNQGKGGFMNRNNFGAYSSAQMGLMY